MPPLWKNHSLPHRLPQTVCGFGDICVKCEPPLWPPLPPSHANTKGPTPTFVSSDALSSGERLGGRGMCACGVCVCVKVVRHLLQSDEETDLQMPRCCQSWPGSSIRVKYGVIQCEKGSAKVQFPVTVIQFLFVVFCSQTRCCVQPDHWLTSSCHFHRVANWPLLLATEMWLNFKVILINTVLRKQWLYNVSGCGARTGRNIIPPSTFFPPTASSSQNRMCSRWCKISALVHKTWHVTHSFLGQVWWIWPNLVGVRKCFRHIWDQEFIK